jgi:hypothetical protein
VRGWRFTPRDGPSRPSLRRFVQSRGLLVFTISLLLVTRPLRAGAQLFVRPWLEWHTLQASRFDIHYPTELASWAAFVAARLPGIDSAVTQLVGYSPPMRVQIVIEDPFDISNGFAFTLIDHPVIVFWASPPDPRESIGQFRSWGEMLAVHEYGHMAHLTRPSRNPLFRALWRVAPVDLGPIPLRAPRWVIEGYATYIEGVVTGSGRPHGVWRPAVLRQWAIEGRLPNYAELSSWSDFQGGEFAYLAGSAFLEWLARRGGDSSLVDLWRRLTARVNRSFDAAFAGVYGDSPALLYDRFRAEVTAAAVNVDRALVQTGVADGELIQHLSRGTGDPAISPDGHRVALVLRSAARPSRVVVWSTAPEPDTLERKARARLLARDSVDVPARRVYPTPKRSIVTLFARDGRSFEDPRWFADNKRLLLWRSTRRPDGSLRPELYVWDVVRNSVRSLTSRAAIRDADPSPDGRRAAALRCLGGHCDVVLVDLSTAAVRTVAAGDVLTSFARPRWSPDGSTIVVAMQRDNRWRVVLLDSAGTARRFADPDDGANRFEPSWIASSSLVVVSDRSGAPNLERIDLGEGGEAHAQLLTRLVGAAVAPDANRADGSIWFLSLHSQGYDVRRLPTAAAVAQASPLPLVSSTASPIMIERAPSVRVFAPMPLAAPRSYGLGERVTRWMPAAAATANGRSGTLALVNTDAVGRLTMLAQGALASGDAWRGGAVDAAWRTFRPGVRFSVFAASTSTLEMGSGVLVSNDDLVEALRGGSVRTDYSYAFDRGDLRIGIGGSGGWAEERASGVSSRLTRNLGFLEIGGDTRQRSAESSASESFLINASAGKTEGGASYRRIVSSAIFRGAGDRTLPLDARVSFGLLSRGAANFEQFVVGGAPSALVDPSLLSQRIPMGALPAGSLVGDRLFTYRVSTSLEGIAPYYWAGSTRIGAGRFANWQRVAGVEWTIDQTALPVIGLPGARLTAGVGRSFDSPLARRIRAYLSVTLRP